MKFLRSLKLEELEQRVVPVVLMAGVPGQDTFTFTDSDGDLVRIEFGNLFNPLGSTGGSVEILNSDGGEPGTAGNPDIATIVFDDQTGNKTDFDIEVVGGSGDGSVEAGDITAPAALRRISITGNVGNATLYGFDTNGVASYLYATFLTRGITGNVDRIMITGGNLGVVSESSMEYPEIKIEIAGRLDEFVVSGGIGDGIGGGFVTIYAEDGIGDITAEYFGQGSIETPGNLHSLTLSGTYNAGAATTGVEGGLYIGSLGDSVTGSGGILCQKINGTVIAAGTENAMGFTALIEIWGDCYADIIGLDEITGIFIKGYETENVVVPDVNAQVFINIGGDLGPYANVTSGGVFANFTRDAVGGDVIFDLENPPLTIGSGDAGGNLEGRVVTHLQGNTDFDTEYFAFNLGSSTPTFSLRGHAATRMDIIAGGDMANTASIEVFGSALEVGVEDIDIYSFSNTQQIRDIHFNQDIVGAVTISHGIPDNGSLNVGSVLGSLTIDGGVDGAVNTGDVTQLTVIGDSSGRINIAGNITFATFYGNLAGDSADADDIMKLEAYNFGVIDIQGDVGEFVQINASEEISLLQVSGSFQSSYYNPDTEADVYTLNAGDNVKFVKIDGPVSGEVTALLRDTPNLRTKVDVNHVVYRENSNEALPGSLHIIDDSGNDQFLRISGGKAVVNMLPTENGNVITRIEVISGKPSIELYGAEVGHIVSNKSLGSIYLDPLLFFRNPDTRERELYDFQASLVSGEVGTSQVFTIESRRGGIRNIFIGSGGPDVTDGAGGDVVRILSEKSVGNIYAGMPKVLGAKAKDVSEFGSHVSTDSDVGVLEIYDGYNVIIEGLTGVYVADGNVGNTYATGDIANYEVFGRTGDIRAFYLNSQIPGYDGGNPSWYVFETDSGGLRGGSLWGFFDIDGKVRDFGALNDIDVQYINVGGNVRDIEARGWLVGYGNIRAEEGITVASSIRNVEAGFPDYRHKFAAAGDITADITSINGNIKSIRGMNITGDISACKKISKVHADCHIGQRIADGVYVGSIYAGKLGKIYADNDIYADITSEKNVSRIIANYDGDIRGGIYGDIDIARKAGRIEAYEDITGNIDIGRKCSKLISENGSFTGDINIGKLSRWELKSDSIVEISGVVNIDKLSRLKAENAVISGNITLGKLSKKFNTLEDDPEVISGTAPFEFRFRLGNPDGTLIIERGNSKTINKIK